MNNYSYNPNGIENTIRKVCKKIAPVWPLENFVAVNPYLGLTSQPFEDVAQDLAVRGGIKSTLGIAFYLGKLKEGVISKEDLALVLSKRQNTTSIDEFISIIEASSDQKDPVRAVNLVSDVATQISGKDWGRFMTSRVSVWAASYFDMGQASWRAANHQKGIYASWKEEASIDRSTEIMGLTGFREKVRELPDDPIETIAYCLNKLKINPKAMELYLHSLLLHVSGWSAHAARLDWDSELNGKEGNALIEFLAILLCWEISLLECINTQKLRIRWTESADRMVYLDVDKRVSIPLSRKLILHEAYELSAQRRMIKQFKKPLQKETSGQIKAQAVFCIDVRSEIFRRNWEQTDSRIETFGFAGFFGLPLNYTPIGHEHAEAQCPVLLKPGVSVAEKIEDQRVQNQVVKSKLFRRELQQVWKTFKSSAVSNFSYVSPIGLSYLPKLFTDSFGITKPVNQAKTWGLSKEKHKTIGVNLSPSSFAGAVNGIELSQQISLAKNALSAMSLTDNFAEFILIVGHGANMVNNPHASGYDCGACGGRSGEANARVFATMLNNREVRAGLQQEDIYIPVDTVFLACLHDTTTDMLNILNEFDSPIEKQSALEELKKSISNAGKATRRERSMRMLSGIKEDIDKSIMERSKDWSQIRPEWGLAGCSLFVVAPREKTKHINLDGKSFLHSYDWTKDDDFKILEGIMTAPMVVTNWINLQYFGSTVDNNKLGSGNKVLHNVTSGIGVLEGFTGDLRVGLPFQSIHDGEKYQHEPLKLNVVIDAPIDAINSILQKHKGIKDLCNNGWLHLWAMDEEGNVNHKYLADLDWESPEYLAA